MEYIRRVVDDEIDRKTEAFNAVNENCQGTLQNGY